MNKSLIAISGILLLFLLNIVLYSQSENYRFFIKKIKNRDQIVYPNEWKVNDTLPNTITVTTDSTPSQEETEILKNSTIISRNDEPQKTIEIKPQPIAATTQTILGKNYQDILSKFKKYNLGKLELHSDLFDVTDEYPDEYYEYYSRDVTLYLFPTKTYQDILDIFKVQPELPIEINQVNNFWNNSFYINLVPKDEKNVRIVVNYKSSVFGLKIKKDEYNEVKQILNNL